MQESPDSRQPGIARANAVVPLLLQIVEKRQDQCGVEVTQAQGINGFTQLVLGEAE